MTLDEMNTALSALQKAYATGQKRVVYRHNGVEYDTTYQDGPAMERAIAYLKGEIAAGSGGSAIGISVARFP